MMLQHYLVAALLLTEMVSGQKVVRGRRQNKNKNDASFFEVGNAFESPSSKLDKKADQQINEYWDRILQMSTITAPEDDARADDPLDSTVPIVRITGKGGKSGKKGKGGKAGKKDIVTDHAGRLCSDGGDSCGKGGGKSGKKGSGKSGGVQERAVNAPAPAAEQEEDAQEQQQQQQQQEIQVQGDNDGGRGKGGKGKGKGGKGKGKSGDEPEQDVQKQAVNDGGKGKGGKGKEGKKGGDTGKGGKSGKGGKESSGKEGKKRLRRELLH